MALTVTHDTAADGTFSAAGVTHWDAPHTLAGSIAESEITFTDIVTNDFSITAHGFVPKGTNVGSFLKDDGTWAAPSASATLDGITAAA